MDDLEDPLVEKNKSQLNQGLRAEFENYATLPPVKPTTPEEHAQLDMQTAQEEEQVHHWGHILFAIFGFLALATALALVFVISIAFTAGGDSSNQLIRILSTPGLALVLAYATLISIILGIIGLGLGEWHHRTR